VDAFHLGNHMLTEVRQRLTQELKGRRGRTADPVRAHRRLLLRAGETLSDRGRDRLRKVFDLDDPTGKLQTAWKVKEQLRALPRTGSLQDAAAKDRLGVLLERAAQPETTRLWHTICRWWQETEVLIITSATTAKVEANNTAIKHLKRTGRGFVNSRKNYTTRIMLRSAARTAA
jgi:transposase